MKTRNVYAAFQPRGFANESVLVIAPSEAKLEDWAGEKSNADPNTRTIRIRATDKLVREFKALEAHPANDGWELPVIDLR